MILASRRDGRSYEAVITGGHPKAPRGGAVLVVGGMVLDPQESTPWGFELVSATEAERMLLLNSGYLQSWSTARARAR